MAVGSSARCVGSPRSCLGGLASPSRGSRTAASAAAAAAAAAALAALTAWPGAEAASGSASSPGDCGNDSVASTAAPATLSGGGSASSSSSSPSSSSRSFSRSRSPNRNGMILRQMPLPLLSSPAAKLPVPHDDEPSAMSSPTFAVASAAAGEWVQASVGADHDAQESMLPSRASRRKRPPDDLSLLCELPAREAEAVSLAMEQWSRLRYRVKALEPTLRREAALVQEILDTGLRDENRRTLRKLTQSSASGGDVEETIQQVAKAIGANRERLERILERNHGELVRLSTTAVSDLKEEVLREVDEVLARLKRALGSVRTQLLGAKERADMTAVRRIGRSFNDLKALVRRMDDERRLITRNSALAALLVTVCRRVLPVRQVDPSALRAIPPSCEGYRRIMEFFFFTDAGLYFFGDYPSGPNWFVRLKRNVAILSVEDEAGNLVYNHFAVSGEHRAPGAPLAPVGGLLRSTDAADEHGRVFNRQHDAEFKLLSGLCAEYAGTSGHTLAGTGTLWSRKPLCRSCLEAVNQVQELFPKLSLKVSVGAMLPEEEGEVGGLSPGSAIPRRCTCIGRVNGSSTSLGSGLGVVAEVHSGNRRRVRQRVDPCASACITAARATGLAEVAGAVEETCDL
eukprot:TRINITY_DN32185_c0_g1_i1.p1 TRINITY_DN32185_c0_g1~~TRINITY_DN32185_c0_g1_i1.p1  ORF type:complete len:711 (+),score=115.23 TRINITY_DN32185_c0_g1_i1:249-2135(+)